MFYYILFIFLCCFILMLTTCWKCFRVFFLFFIWHVALSIRISTIPVTSHRRVKGKWLSLLIQFVRTIGKSSAKRSENNFTKSSGEPFSRSSEWMFEIFPELLFELLGNASLLWLRYTWTSYTSEIEFFILPFF